MISFKLTDEQEVVREALHDFAEQAMRPIARDADEESKIPEEFLAQSWELGLVSTQLPEAYGGGGEVRSPVTNAVVLEELAWGDAALAIAATAPAGFAFAVADQGSGSSSRFCSSLPNCMIVGPIVLTGMMWSGARARYVSSQKMNCSMGEAPWPPYSFGQPIPSQPSLPMRRTSSRKTGPPICSSSSSKAARSSGVKSSR